MIFELNIFYCYLQGLSLFNLKLVFGIIIIAVSGFGVFVNNLFVKLIIGFSFFGSIFQFISFGTISGFFFGSIVGIGGMD